MAPVGTRRGQSRTGEAEKDARNLSARPICIAKAALLLDSSYQTRGSRHHNLGAHVTVKLHQGARRGMF